jgi:hypothetical protein
VQLPFKEFSFTLSIAEPRSARYPPRWAYVELEDLLSGLRREPAFQNVEQRRLIGVFHRTTKTGGHAMGFGRGLLLWLIGIPLPIIILLAIFMHH